MGVVHPKAPVRLQRDVDDSLIRLLVVDDEGEVRAAALEALRGMGHIDVACSSREALAYLARWRYAVVVTDQLMPGHTGVWLLSQAARLWPKTRRVLVTDDTREDGRALRDLGVAHAVLRKPVDPAALRGLVSELAAALSNGTYSDHPHSIDRPWWPDRVGGHRPRAG